MQLDPYVQQLHLPVQPAPLLLLLHLMELLLLLLEASVAPQPGLGSRGLCCSLGWAIRLLLNLVR